MGITERFSIELENLQGDLMTLFDGYENESGIFLHYKIIDGERATIEIKFYAPDDSEFAWALEQLRTLEN